MGTMLANLSNFAALMLAISMGVERVVEVVKGAVPVLANAWKKHDEVRCSIIQLLSIVAGTVIASQMPAQINGSLPVQLQGPVTMKSSILIGLICSGGSSVWNHVIDILGALKVKQETSAKVAQAAVVPAQ
jgi:hypothetical protein